MSNSRCIRLHRSIFLFSSVLQPSPLFNASQSQSPSLSQGGDCECLHLCNPAYPQIAWRSSIHSLCGRPMVPITSARYRTILNTSEWPNPLKRAIFCILLSSDGLGSGEKRETHLLGEVDFGIHGISGRPLVQSKISDPVQAQRKRRFLIA